MNRKEFFKPNKAKIKIFILMLLAAGVYIAIVGSVFVKSIQSGLLWGPSYKPNVLETIILTFSLILFFPTLITWMTTYSFIKVFGIVIGLVLNLVYLYYFSCLIDSFSKSKA